MKASPVPSVLKSTGTREGVSGLPGPCSFLTAGGNEFPFSFSFCLLLLPCWLLLAEPQTKEEKWPEQVLPPFPEWALPGQLGWRKQGCGHWGLGCCVGGWARKGLRELCASPNPMLDRALTLSFLIYTIAIIALSPKKKKKKDKNTQFCSQADLGSDEIGVFRVLWP